MFNPLPPFAMRAFSSRRASANFCRHENKFSDGSHGDGSEISLKELSLIGPLSEGEVS